MNKIGLMQNYRPVMWRLFFVTYGLGIILLHRQANLLAGRLIEFLGLPSYLLSTRLLASAGAVTTLVFLGKNLSKLKDRARLKELLIFVPAALTLDLSFISVPIERIHYPQYGLLTWIGYKATGKPFNAAVMAFVIGIADEAHQYWVLYANDRIVYFDWNDVVLNLIGVLAALLFFLPREPASKAPKKYLFAAIVLWILTVNLLVLLLNPDRYLFRDDPYKGSSSFWITSNINTTYHVMNSSQGLTFLGLVLILIIGYWFPRHFPFVQVNTEVDSRDARTS